MIIDSHCHVWETWPYEPAVPDPQVRGRAEQLLFEMDQAQVERAVIICAAIGENARNAEYAFEAAARHRGRFVVFPDLECRWSPTFRTPGAAARLETALARWDFAGFTLYPEIEEDGSWLSSAEGTAFFDLAAGKGLIASLSVLPHQVPAVADLARRHPAMPILCHHLAHFGTRTPAVDPMSGLSAIASLTNVYVKVSGMGNVTTEVDEFPYPRLQPVFDMLLETIGPDRLVWGSDYPVSRRHMTYRQTLGMVRYLGVDDDAQRRITGTTMAALLTGSPQSARG